MKEMSTVEENPIVWDSNIFNNFSSKDPRVDGTNLTSNSIVKAVRKRHVSKVKNIRRPSKANVFVQLCKWLSGSIDAPLEEPSMLHIDLLRKIRSNRLDELPPAYKFALDNNTEVIEQASKLKPKDIKQKYKNFARDKKLKAEKETKAKVLNIKPKDSFEKRLDKVLTAKTIEASATSKKQEDSSSLQVSSQGQAKFLQWVLDSLKGNPVSKEHHYCSYVTYYLGHNDTPAAYHPKYVKEILDMYKEELRNYKVCKDKLVLKTISVPKDPITLRAVVTTNVETSKEYFESFVSFLKDKGVKEITLKF